MQTLPPALSVGLISARVIRASGDECISVGAVTSAVHILVQPA